MAIETTFQDFWSRYLETKVRAMGAIAADISDIRSVVKALVVDSGWSDVNENVSFVSNTDLMACVNAATTCATQAVAKVVGNRKTREISAGAVLGHSPTTLSASVAQASMYHLARTNASFNPVMATVGESCPRCQSPMTPVGLVNGKTGIYCPADRVVLPVN